MKIIRGFKHNLKSLHSCIATIGNFDGVHLGHRAIIKKVKAIAAKENLPSLIITFEPQPEEFFSHDNCPSRLTKFREKLEQFKTLGIDYVAVLHFDAELAKLSAEEFLQQILIKQFSIKHLVMGDDFHFGHDRSGNFAYLKKSGLQASICSSVILDKKENSRKISSTWVREVLQKGNLEIAKKLLGRSYSMCGYVVHGDKIGRIIGFPTANIYLHRKKSPLLGVYAVQMFGADTKPVFGIANIGWRPTVGGNKLLLEVHLFDFDKDIYGHHVRVEFLKKIRDEKKFNSFDELKQQIFRDTETASSHISHR
jgi:riboflavin kinase / FMN adenylyltransferase